MIRVGIDATSVAPEAKGIARVQRGTVRALAELGRHELVVFARHREELVPRRHRLPPAALVPPLAPDEAVAARAAEELVAQRYEVRPVTVRPTLAWEQLGLARAAREVDVLLTWTERLPAAGRGRYVVWLFEPPTHRTEQNRRVGARAWQRGSDLATLALWRRSLRRARVVLTGSRATADAIAPFAPAARALYPGLEPRFSPGEASRGGYVLHLGSSDPRDDTVTALAAARRADVRLVVAGGYAGPADGAELVGRVSDDELVDLYRGADAFLDTSLYEGFGYQVLEAMACGAPVVASATTSIPEIAGDAALLCPPGDAGAFAAALRRVLDDPGLADDLRRRGVARASEFTWERTARELADALDEAAE